MIAAFTVAQLRTAEAAALARTADGELMRLAAYQVARRAIEMLPEPRPGRQVVLLVGPGNNGGDALYAGAVLRRRGLAVTAVPADPERLHPGGLRALLRAGGRVAADPAERVWGAADLVIDGLLGIGARPPLRGPMAQLVTRANACSAARLAVDVPSGVDPDNGLVTGEAFRADVTVTFGAPTAGLLLADQYAGRIVTAELGLAPDPAISTVGALTDADVAALLPEPGRSDDKFSGGVLGVLAGSDRYPGAAVLSVGAAVRLRPGLVRYAGPARASVLSRWPEVVAVPEPGQAGRVQAWVAGPGMGTDPAARDRLAQVLAVPEPVLIDADGLTLLAAEPGLLTGRAVGSTVLTPHAGEFARLFPDLPVTDRLAAVRAAAARIGQVVLLKGHRTLIAYPGGRVWVTTTGTGWLATAGSGDVLSGVIGSLLAAGVRPPIAAAAGAHLHGRAGEAAERDGVAGAGALGDRLRIQLGARSRGRRGRKTADRAFDGAPS